MGNVEGRDVFRGNVDVVVCDGFIGNIALKLSEGLVEHIGGMLKKAIKSSLTSQLGYALSKRAFDDFRKRTDYSEYGGAPLLGVRGITIIGHGRSNRERHQERHPRRRRTLPRARERKNRTGAFRRCRRCRPRLSGANRTIHYEQARFSFSRPGLAISRHGPRPGRKFSGVARRFRRSGRGAGIFAFEALL